MYNGICFILDFTYYCIQLSSAMKYIPISFLLILLINCKNSNSTKSSDGKTINFENLKQGDSLVVTFAVKNTSQKDIKIVHITAPCSCTKIAYDSATISPDKTGDISVKYKSGNDTGYVSRALVVETSDTASPLQTFYLRGNVVSKEVSK